jgi:hypothetical protein
VSVDLVKELRDLVEVPDFARLFGVVSLVTEAADELERLRAIEGKMPKTADGVAIMYGDWVWYSRKRFRPNLDTLTIPCAVPVGEGGWRDLHVSECYSTREAAEAAMNGGHQ